MSGTDNQNGQINNPEIKAIEKQAISIWESLTDTELNSTSFSFGIGVGDLDFCEANRRLNRSKRLDATGISTLLIFRHLYEAFIEHKSFTMREFLDSPALIRAELDQVLLLKSLLHNGAVNPFLDGFVKSMESALMHYGIAQKDGEFSSYAGYLRLDALIAMSELRKFTFNISTPAGDAKPVKYSKQIFKFWNINSLLRLSAHMDDGIALCVIQEPDASDSYFCFAVKNGSTVSIVTDKKRYAHPAQASMKRNNRADFERMGQHWFPYHILGLEYEPESKTIEQNQTSTGLVSYQIDMLPVASISDLAIEESAWIVMMFDLVKERYFHRNTKEQLAYTNSMIVSETSLLEEAKHLPIVVDNALVMPKITVKEVLRNEMNKVEKEWAEMPFYNGWIEERFAADISDDLLVVMSQDKNLELLPSTSNDKEFVVGAYTGEENTFSKRKSYPLNIINPTEFGTRDELIKDAKWLARYNLARVLQKKLDDEFEVEEEKALNWYTKNVTAYLPEMVKKLVSFDDDYFNLLSTDEPPEFGESAREMGIGRKLKISRKIHSATGTPFGLGVIGAHIVTPRGSDNRHPGWADGSKATLFFKITVGNALDIPKVTGIALEDLPVHLRHYKMKGYLGNSTLNRLDPVDAYIRSPWDEVCLNVIVPLSKSMFTKLRAELGLPKITDLSQHFGVRE